MEDRDTVRVHSARGRGGLKRLQGRTDSVVHPVRQAALPCRSLCLACSFLPCRPVPAPTVASLMARGIRPQEARTAEVSHPRCTCLRYVRHSPPVHPLVLGLSHRLFDASKAHTEPTSPHRVWYSPLRLVVVGLVDFAS